jgi:hypothetical protein
MTPDRQRILNALVAARHEIESLRSGGGNPNHVPSGPHGGQFASGKGNGSGNGKPADRAAKRRERRRKLVANAHKEGKRDVADTKKEQRSDRKDLIKTQRKEHTSLRKEHATEVKEHHADTVKEHKSLDRTNDRERRQAERAFEREHKWADQAHERERGRIQDKHEAATNTIAANRIAHEKKLKAAAAKGKGRPDLEGRLEAKSTAKLKRLGDKKDRLFRKAAEHHAERKAELEAGHEDQRKTLAQEHADAHEMTDREQKRALANLKFEHMTARQGQRHEHRDERQAMKDQHRENRQEYVASALYALHGEGVRRKGNKPLASETETLWSVKNADRNAKRARQSADFAARQEKIAEANSRRNEEIEIRYFSTPNARKEWEAKNEYRYPKLVKAKRSADGNSIQVHGETDSLPEGLPDHLRRLSPTRTHKASSADAILRACLRARGWTRAWKYDELTGGQHIELLEDVREYGKSWLHHEAMGLIGTYGRTDGSRGTTSAVGEMDRGIRDSSGSSLVEDQDRRTLAGSDHLDIGGTDYRFGIRVGVKNRALGPELQHHIGRFFRRAKSFVHELVIAGAMALSGPEPLTVADLAAIDQEIQVQHQYFDRFHTDVTILPATPSLSPEEVMSAKQFAARAELYGNTGWTAPQNVLRKRQRPTGTLERRVHTREDAHHWCETCDVQTGMGWCIPGVLREIGDSECRGNCDCAYQYMYPDGVIRWSNGRTA